MVDPTIAKVNTTKSRVRSRVEQVRGAIKCMFGATGAGGMVYKANTRTATFL